MSLQIVRQQGRRIRGRFISVSTNCLLARRVTLMQPGVHNRVEQNSPWSRTVHLTPCGLRRWGYVFTIAKHRCITICSIMFNLNNKISLYISSLGLPRPCQSPASCVFTFSFHFRYHLNQISHYALSVFITTRLQLYFLLSLFPD